MSGSSENFAQTMDIFKKKLEKIKDKWRGERNVHLEEKTDFIANARVKIKNINEICEEFKPKLVELDNIKTLLELIRHNDGYNSLFGDPD